MEKLNHKRSTTSEHQTVIHISYKLKFKKKKRTMRGQDNEEEEVEEEEEKDRRASTCQNVWFASESGGDGKRKLLIPKHM